MPKKKKYGNILDVPLSPNLLLLGNDWIKQRDIDLKEREIELFKEYGLTRPEILNSQARDLIRFMARDLKIKGFMENNEVKPTGRPSKWKDFNEMLLLFIRVHLMQQRHPEMDLRSIIRNITQRYYPENKPDGIYARYNELQNLKNTEIKCVKTIIDNLSENGLDGLAKDMAKALYENK